MTQEYQSSYSLVTSLWAKELRQAPEDYKDNTKTNISFAGPNLKQLEVCAKDKVCWYASQKQPLQTLNARDALILPKPEKGGRQK